MKEILKIVGYVILALLLLSVIVYGILGFGNFLFSDPLHWLSDKPVQTQEQQFNPYQVDIDKCRTNGGYPVVSGWDGSLKDCKKF